jgi:hypothetical protein
MTRDEEIELWILQKLKEKQPMPYDDFKTFEEYPYDLLWTFYVGRIANSTANEVVVGLHKEGAKINALGLHRLKELEKIKEKEEQQQKAEELNMLHTKKAIRKITFDIPLSIISILIASGSLWLAIVQKSDVQALKSDFAKMIDTAQVLTKKIEKLQQYKKQNIQAKNIKP